MKKQETLTLYCRINKKIYLQKLIYILQNNTKQLYETKESYPHKACLAKLNETVPERLPGLLRYLLVFLSIDPTQR